MSHNGIPLKFKDLKKDGKHGRTMGNHPKTPETNMTNFGDFTDFTRNCDVVFASAALASR
jgi:hypothetical protein